jgi:hypothetical protein
MFECMGHGAILTKIPKIIADKSQPANQIRINIQLSRRFGLFPSENDKMFLQTVGVQSHTECRPWNVRAKPKGATLQQRNHDWDPWRVL